LLKAALLSPMPARAGQTPESGVAAYTASLLAKVSNKVDVTVLAQASTIADVVGNVKVVPTWTANRRLPGQLRRALARISPDVLHVQHEFNLYGGLAQGALLTASLFAMRLQGMRIATTIHGVVDPSEVTAEFVLRNSLPGSRTMIRGAFRAAYWGLAQSSNLLIVHHEYFRRLLVNSYGLPESKILTIRPGVSPSSDGGLDDKGRKPQVLMLGFLTGYKLPEIVVDVAESTALPGVQFRFCMGKNPRVRDRAYSARYAALEKRVRAMRGRAEWSGYIPDDEFDTAVANAAVLVLPYTECVSVSGIAAAAQRFRTTVCHSRPLRPLFGAGALEFELTAASLAGALSSAFAGVSGSSIDQFTPWDETARLTEEAWRQLSRR
jgi:glycosyltransferase involved in cell wall biosynthesis